MNTLTIADLHYLRALCNAEFSLCGLDTSAGRKARAMADKLTACMVTFPSRPSPPSQPSRETQRTPG